MIKSSDYHGGVYLDNSSRYITIRNNVYVECPKWIRFLWYNTMDNVGRNNYATRFNSYNGQTEQNDIDSEILLIEGQWSAAAVNIAEKAGLSEAYSRLYDTYAQKSAHYTNPALENLKFIDKAGIIVPAGDYMEGGEGVAYHNIVDNINGMSIAGEPYKAQRGYGMYHYFLHSTAFGEWTQYKVEIAESGTYDIILNVAAAGMRRAHVYVDGIAVATNVAIQQTCTNYDDLFSFCWDEARSKMKDFYATSVYLTAGTHYIKVEQALSSFIFNYFRLVKQGEEWGGRNDGFNTAITNAILACQ
jgi:hypothetical protein